eukprot:TRINITY_DN7128_c0_g1_i1.p1 TRINITY_DN7128_c0_g1~~TRINITY_DN7128_c0_g1_i1.p1  ORF type:complete len:945 (-),score=168.56 TRINITY_DN7128_c0_g1_i1:72-2906(-)
MTSFETHVKSTFVAIYLLLSMCSSVRSQSVKFNSTSGVSDWFNPYVWDSGIVPNNSTVDVTIDSCLISSCTIIINQSVTVGTLTVNAPLGAYLTLNITGNFTFGSLQISAVLLSTVIVNVESSTFISLNLSSSFIISPGLINQLTVNSNSSRFQVPIVQNGGSFYAIDSNFTSITTSSTFSFARHVYSKDFYLAGGTVSADTNFLSDLTMDDLIWESGELSNGYFYINNNALINSTNSHNTLNATVIFKSVNVTDSSTLTVTSTNITFNSQVNFGSGTSLSMDTASCILNNGKLITSGITTISKGVLINGGELWGLTFSNSQVFIRNNQNNNLIFVYSTINITKESLFLNVSLQNSFVYLSGGNMSTNGLSIITTSFYSTTTTTTTPSVIFLYNSVYHEDFSLYNVTMVALPSANTTYGIKNMNLYGTSTFQNYGTYYVLAKDVFLGAKSSILLDSSATFVNWGSITIDRSSTDLSFEPINTGGSIINSGTITIYTKLKITSNKFLQCGPGTIIINVDTTSSFGLMEFVTPSLINIDGNIVVNYPNNDTAASVSSLVISSTLPKNGSYPTIYGTYKDNSSNVLDVVNTNLTQYICWNFNTSKLTVEKASTTVCDRIIPNSMCPSWANIVVPFSTPVAPPTNSYTLVPSDHPVTSVVPTTTPTDSPTSAPTDVPPTFAPTATNVVPTTTPTDTPTAVTGTPTEPPTSTPTMTTNSSSSPTVSSCQEVLYLPDSECNQEGTVVTNTSTIENSDVTINKTWIWNHDKNEDPLSIVSSTITINNNYGFINGSLSINTSIVTINSLTTSTSLKVNGQLVVNSGSAIYLNLDASAGTTTEPIIDVGSCLKISGKIHVTISNLSPRKNVTLFASPCISEGANSEITVTSTGTSTTCSRVQTFKSTHVLSFFMDPTCLMYSNSGLSYFDVLSFNTAVNFIVSTLSLFLFCLN